MPNIKSAIKRVKTNEKRRASRASQMSSLRSKIKSYEQSVVNATTDEAQAAFIEVQRQLDKAASKGLLHKNAAKRHLSRLAKLRNQATK